MAESDPKIRRTGAPDGQAPERPPGGRPEEPPPWPRIEPSSDGRGKRPEKQPMVPKQGRRTLIMIFVALLAVNVIFALVTGRPQSATQVPYSPFFLQQVQQGNVQEISSKGETIDGKLKEKAPYRPQDAKKTTDVDHF